MKLYILLISSLFLLLIPKDNPEKILPNLQSIIQKKKLTFCKSDTLDMIKIFGDSYEVAGGGASVTGIDRELVLYDRILMYYYEDLDIEVVFKQSTIDLWKGKKGEDEDFIFSKIKVYSCFEGKIFNDIKIGETFFKDLPQNSKSQEVIIIRHYGDAILRKQYKNYLFFTKIDNANEISDDELKTKAEDTSVKYIEIIHKKGKHLPLNFHQDYYYSNECEEE